MRADRDDPRTERRGNDQVLLVELRRAEVRAHVLRGRHDGEREVPARRSLDHELRGAHPPVVIREDVHRAETHGYVPKEWERQLAVVEPRRAAAGDPGALALHREEDVAGVLDRLGECLVVRGAIRAVEERDVERDDGWLQGLQGPEQVRVGLPWQRVAPVLLDRRVVESDDRDLVRELARMVRDERVVDGGLEVGIERPREREDRREAEPESADQGEHGPLAELPACEHAVPSVPVGPRPFLAGPPRGSRHGIAARPLRTAFNTAIDLSYSASESRSMGVWS